VVDLAPRAVQVQRTNFEDLWQPFLGGQGPAGAYAMWLTPSQRDALRDGIRSGMPIAGDGSTSLVARAWAIRGLAR
jgi:hypothetical protein